MISTGLDTAFAPTAQQAKAMLDAVGGSFWLVYLPSGTRNGGVGWTPQLVEQYALAGIAEYLPCWVGSQILPGEVNDPLTAELGHQHGRRAVADMVRFGWLAGCPVALDIEYSTAQGNPEGAVAYCDGWCVAVREGNYVPGVYAPLFFLERLSHEDNAPDFAYAADWIRHGVDHGLSPDHIPGLPDNVWQHARVWQYSGGDARVNGISVDMDVADFPLAPQPGLPMPHSPAPAPSPAYIVTVPHFLRKTPVLVAPHGSFVHRGELLTTTGKYTTHWAAVHTPDGTGGWAFREHLRPAPRT